jgi:hypothetical protein
VPRQQLEGECAREICEEPNARERKHLLEFGKAWMEDCDFQALRKHLDLESSADNGWSYQVVRILEHPQLKRHAEF